MGINAQKMDTVHIYFGFDSSDIKPVEAKILDRIAKNSKKTDSIRIYGYCDKEGSNTYNDKLAAQRANEVKGYLTGKGVSEEKIILLKGFGKRRPINKNLTSQERSLNRRVDIIFPYHNPKPIAKKLSLDSAKTGQVIILKNLNFYGGSHRLLPESKPILEELLTALKKNPTIEIKIVGHVCCTDGVDGVDFDLNTDDLSWRRAQAVYLYLTSKGINKKRLTFTGMAGKHHLVWPEETEEDRTMNRRVEIQIVKR